ncbi:MAG: hypothetical protein H6673_16735 [Anaerolineales bacterium]|nr:hypothetical protein [Anaerolineales bacterium]
MSNFDDLPDWLKGDMDDEPSSTPDDQANWTQPPSSADDVPEHFGVTSALPWRQGISDDPKRQTAGLGDVDWESLGNTEEASGDADDLAWLNESAFPDADADQDQPTTDHPQWIDDAGFEEPDLDLADLEAVSAESMPDWLSGAESFGDEAGFEEPDFDMDDLGAVNAESMSDWFGDAEGFGESDSLFFEDSDTTYDTPAPNWLDEDALEEEPSPLRSLDEFEGEIDPEDLDGLLLDIEDDFAFDEEPETIEPQSQEPKIRRLGAKKDVDEDELTFEAWERLQEQKEYETDHAEELAIQAEVPDWFRDNVELGDAAGDELASILIPDLEDAPPQTPAPQAEMKADYVPEWFMGLEEQNLEDAPDWIKEATTNTDLGSLTDISAFVPPEPEQPSTPEPELAEPDDVPDWFKGIGVDLPDMTTPTAVDSTADFGLPNLTGLPDLTTSDQDVLVPDFMASDDLGLPDLTASEEEAEAVGDAFAFSDIGTEEQAFDFLGLGEDEDELATGDVPEWLRDYAPAQDQLTQDTAFQFEDESAPEMDWLGDLSEVEFTDESAADFSDFASEVPKPAAKQPDRDILAGSGTLDELLDFVEHTAPSGLVPAPSDRRVLAQQSQQLTDLFDGVDDDLLQALESASEKPASQPTSEAQPDLVLAEVPDLIAELRPEESVRLRAGGIELEFAEQSETHLATELRNLHKRTSVPSASESMPTSGPLSGVMGGLGIVGLTTTAGTPASRTGLEVTPTQATRIDALAAILEIDQPDDWQEDEGEALAEVEAKPRRRRRQRAKRKPDRYVIVLLLLAALIGPFLTDSLHVGEAPETQELGVDQQAVLTAVDTLENQERVLIAFEYGPTAAGELNGLAEAVLRDVIRQGAVPVVLSTNPLGALNAQNLIQELARDTALLDSIERDTPLEAGQDYYVLRYISGGAASIRGLTTSEILTTLIFSTDSRGEKTDLDIGTVDADDFEMVIIIGETTEDVRNWAEQFDVVGLPMYALVTAAIEPLTQAYVGAAYRGYLAGYRDTYRYNQLRNPKSANETDGDLPDPTLSQWYSMTLGVVMVAVIITLGTLINLLRGLRRRRA